MKTFKKYPSSYIKSSSDTAVDARKLVTDSIQSYIDEFGEPGFVDDSKDVYAFVQDEYTATGKISDCAKKLEEKISEDPTILDYEEDIQDCVIYECAHCIPGDMDEFMKICYKYGHPEVVSEYE